MSDLYKRRFAELQQQMEALLASKATVYSQRYERNYVEIDGTALLEWKVKAKNLLSKACGGESEHYKAFCGHETRNFGTNLGTLERLKAIFLAAREDYDGGYLRPIRSLIQVEVFDSELEQARALLSAGHKSPSAVVAGVVLETSLRELCDRHGLPHGKLDKMNADLAKAGTYNKLQQKRITALADIRNSAAHGNPNDFNPTSTVCPRNPRKVAGLPWFSSLSVVRPHWSCESSWGLYSRNSDLMFSSLVPVGEPWSLVESVTYAALTPKFCPRGPGDRGSWVKERDVEDMIRDIERFIAENL